MAEVYGSLVILIILVILVIEDEQSSVMTLGDSLTGIGYAQQAMATHAVLDNLHESDRGFVS